MKVLLFCPNIGKNTAEKNFLAPALGLERLAAYIRKKTMAEVNICDLTIDEFPKDVAEYDIIGFSIYHYTLENDISLIHKCKRISSNSLLLAGGVEATFNYEQIFENSPVDIIILGEGEKPLLELINLKKAYKNIKKIKGIVVRRDDGITLPNYNAPLNQTEFEEATLSIDFNKIDIIKYWDANAFHYNNPNYLEINAVRIFTGNYCPYKCAFCSSTNFLNFSSGDKKVKLVYLPNDGVIKLIKNALDARPETKTIIFDDDNFMLNKRRVIELCNGILENKKNNKLPKDLSFICQGRIDAISSIYDSKILKLMRKAGFRMFLCGVESFSQHILDSLNKRIKVNMIWKAVDAMLEAGIKPHLYVILFTPWTTLKDLKMSLKYIVNYIKKGCDFGVNEYIQLLPGSDLMINKQNYKIRYKDINNKEFGINFQKEELLLPNDPKIMKIADNLDSDIEHFRKEVISKYGIKHFPDRTEILLMVYVLADILDERETKYRIKDMFEEFL